MLVDHPQFITDASGEALTDAVAAAVKSIVARAERGDGGIAHVASDLAEDYGEPVVGTSI